MPYKSPPIGTVRTIAVITNERLNDEFVLVRIVLDGRLLFVTTAHPSNPPYIPRWSELGVRKPDRVIYWSYP